MHADPGETLALVDSIQHFVEADTQLIVENTPSVKLCVALTFSTLCTNFYHNILRVHLTQLGMDKTFIACVYSAGFLGCMAGGVLVSSPTAKAMNSGKLILISLCLIALGDLLMGPSLMLGLPNDVRLIPIGIFLCNMSLIWMSVLFAPQVLHYLLQTMYLAGINETALSDSIIALSSMCLSIGSTVASVLPPLLFKY